MAAALLGATLAGCGATDGDTTEGATMVRIEVESSAFGERDRIPSDHTCDGADRSPPLAWGAGPAGTVGYALVADDPDAPGGTWVHWVAWNLPATALPAGVPARAELEDGTRQGRNSWGRTGYGGPCPPSGTHRYSFRVYALDAALELPAETDAAALMRAAGPHVLAEGELVGLYSRE